VAGFIRYRDLIFPGLGLDDILDMNEILNGKNENEYRAMKAAENK